MKKETKRPAKAGAKADDYQGGASKPVSLAPLTFEEALAGLLQTDAEAVRELERKDRLKREKKRAAKKASK